MSDGSRLPPGSPPWDTWNGARIGFLLGGVAGALVGAVAGWIVPALATGAVIGAVAGYRSEARRIEREKR